MFLDPAPFFKVMVKDTAAQGPDMVCNFILVFFHITTAQH